MKLNEMQLYSALNEYIDREMMPLGATMKMTDQFFFGVKMGIVKRRLQEIIKGYLYKPELKAFGIVDENGYVDIDLLYQSASDTMSQMNQLDIAGFTFKLSDLQNLYGVMQRYA